MGLIDRIRAWNAGAEDAEPAVRSPLEQQLIARLQRNIAETGTDAAPIRLHLRFTGQVQGVGFRWTNMGLARDRGLTGWVMNLDDGSVRMEIQGTPAQLIMHLDELHAYYRRFRNRIWLDEEREIPVDPTEESFEARYEPGISF